MQGIEIARAFYQTKLVPLIERDFAQYKDRIAIGLVGRGSECYGFDDEISKDHDFEPSLCIWLDDEDEREFGFALFRAYSKLCKDHNGDSKSEKSLGGTGGRGVMTISEFYRGYTGRKGAPETLDDWLYTPSHYLAEATNGVVFCDPLGNFSEIREQIKHGIPSDVRLKKIASCAFYMAQAGQYNYKRCLVHGEVGASRLALAEFAKNASEMVYLLNNEHMPYYKWCFRGMRSLDVLSDSADRLTDILCASACDEEKAIEKIECFCKDVIAELLRQGLTDSRSDYLENHAYSINEKIKDSRLRNLPVML